MISTKLILTASLIAQIAFTAESVEKKLFTMEKNYHADNIMVINTLTDDSCKFVSKNNEYLDFYWLMDRATRKEINPVIRSQIQERVKFSSINNERNSYKIRLSDLSELNHDLEDTAMEVSSAVINGKCQVKSVLKLGPSGKYRKLNLKRTYCEVTTNLVGIPNGCKFLDLQGNDADTDEIIKIRFFKK
ncbi:MAG: hypothetical protein H7281_15430 [Bacteriovorax sp.]|nr:hypothetical protein [Bacteriovorax sp.]